MFHHARQERYVALGGCGVRSGLGGDSSGGRGDRGDRAAAAVVVSGLAIRDIRASASCD